jgi:hypothetical protein
MRNAARVAPRWKERRVCDPATYLLLGFSESQTTGADSALCLLCGPPETIGGLC